MWICFNLFFSNAAETRTGAIISAIWTTVNTTLAELMNVFGPVVLAASCCGATPSRRPRPRRSPHRLEADLGGHAYSLVDVSHRQTAIAVQGPEAALALNAAVPLDLSPDAFPVGMATRTIFEKVEIALWRTDETAFRLEVWRSFAPYVLALLQAVGEENGWE